MGTKMKGLLKGLKHISNVFEGEKEQEMQIGLPTDVKHVAHIGWEGSAALESPSWMKEYSGEGIAQSAPLDASGQPLENPEVKWVSQDSSRKKGMKSSSRDLPELPKSSRRQSKENSETTPTTKRDPSTKSRSSRRHQREKSEGSSRGGRRTKEQTPDGPDSPSTPKSKKRDIPKNSRRKKSKDKDSLIDGRSSSKSKDKDASVNGGSTRSTKSDDSLPPAPFSDPGADNADNTLGSSSNAVFPAPKLKPFGLEEEKGIIVVS